MKIIDNLYTRLNRFISDDKFNNSYLPLIEEFKLKEINYIIEIEKYIEEKHALINVGQTPNKNEDFCISFTRIRTFTCRNGLPKQNYSFSTKR